MKGSLLHRDLTDKIIGIFYDVYNELGFGFLESVYEDAMVIALKEAGLRVERQVPTLVWFRNKLLSTFEVDLIVNGLIIIELKAVKQIAEAHIAQLIHYLRATSIEVGLVVNFGHKPEFKRRAFENSRKRSNNDNEPVLKSLFS